MKKRITVAVKSFLTMMLLFSLVIVFPESVNAAFFGVDSWEDCILENLDGAKNDFTIRALVTELSDTRVGRFISLPLKMN